MDMQGACAEVLAELDGSLGCIVIDMQTGITVAAEYRQGSVMNPATVNLVAVLSTNMFQGKLIRQFEGALARPAASGQEFVREVQMATEHTQQFMAAIPGWAGALLVLVTDKTVSVGLGWMAVHRMIGRFGDATPPGLGRQDAAVPQPQPAVPAVTFAQPQPQAAPPAEPFPDANRYAPPPAPPAAAPPLTADAQPPVATQRHQDAALPPQQPALPPQQPAAQPPSGRKRDKPRPPVGPRAALFRRK